jgi:hypothetical protein
VLLVLAPAIRAFRKEPLRAEVFAIIEAAKRADERACDALGSEAALDYMLRLAFERAIVAKKPELAGAVWRSREHDLSDPVVDAADACVRAVRSDSAPDAKNALEILEARVLADSRRGTGDGADGRARADALGRCATAGAWGRTRERLAAEERLAVKCAEFAGGSCIRPK